jgi:hypothetical protein
LTPPSGRPARSIAESYLHEAAPAFNAASLELVKQYQTRHNGVTHFVYRPNFQGLDVFNAEWTVNIGRDGAVINAGGSRFAPPENGVAPPDESSSLRAVRSAAMAVSPRAGLGPAARQVAGSDPMRRKFAQFALPGFGNDIEGRPAWYVVNGALRPAWLFYMQDPETVSNFEVVVDADTQAILAKNDMTWFDGPRGMVFDHSSPQPNPTPGIIGPLLPPIIPRTMQPLTGDPAYSPGGWVTGGETAGNNVAVGLNRLGLLFAPPQTSLASNGDFSFALDLGPGAANPTNYADAAAANLFYWINRAHDLYYALGFDEAAGNYQENNFGLGGVDGDAMQVYTQFGSAAVGAASLNNAFYSSRRSGEDGARSMLAIYLSINRQTGAFVDTAFDPEVTLHEYTHGVSTRLIRQFSSGYPEAGAMGEAFSDFFGLELTLPEGVPVDGSYSQGAYFSQNPAGTRTHLYTTDLNVNPLAFSMFGTVRGYPEVHADGEIWVEALWEVRAAYIRQFGETEGRKRVRQVLIDGMKLAPPAPSMVDMRDAILLADIVDYQGESQSQLWAAFARRGFGVLAMASSSSAVHVVASNTVPGREAAVRAYDSQVTVGEPLRLMVYLPDHSQPNVKVRVTTTYGDGEDVYLDKHGFTYTGSITTLDTIGVVYTDDGYLELVPGDTITVTYNEGQSAQTAIEAKPRYTIVVDPVPNFTFTGEKALGLRGSGIIQSITLPFDFPFYDQTYKTVWLHTNGMLAFSGPLSTSCADSFTLQQHAAIAPLWLSSTSTSGTVQTGEDVYQSSTSDSVTFRFAAQVTGSTGASEALNFATTLYKDGKIAFQYGSGNHNLATFGCGSTPLIGIANGHETAYQLALYSGQAELSNTRSLTIYPHFGATSAPQGAIEKPAAGARVTNLFTVSGVRYDEALPVSRVDLLIDGESASHSPISVRRDDVCNGQSYYGCPFVGFSFTVNALTLGLTPGPHTLQVRVTNARGASANIPETPMDITIDPGPQALPQGKIEAPVDGATITATTTVKGYAYSPNVRVLGVDLLIDGVTWASPAYNQTRTDICASLDGPPPNCPAVGFTYSLNPKSTSMPLAPGTHTLAVRARDELGRFTMLPAITVTVR